MNIKSDRLTAVNTLEKVDSIKKKHDGQDDYKNIHAVTDKSLDYITKAKKIDDKNLTEAQLKEKFDQKLLDNVLKNISRTLKEHTERMKELYNGDS